MSSTPALTVKDLAIRYKSRDYIFLGLGITILVVSIVLRILGYGEFWIPATFL